jgi:hypothetical protein
MAEKAECYFVIYLHQDREFRESSADRLFQQYRACPAARVEPRDAVSAPRRSYHRAEAEARALELTPVRRLPVAAHVGVDDKGHRASELAPLWRSARRAGGRGLWQIWDM